VKTTRVVIAGVSTRAAAESAARAGFQVTAIDAFADLDQHPSVRALSIARPFSADTAARAARDVECDAAVYLSNFENHPEAVHGLGAGRALWGNPPDVLRRVRDPVCLARALRDRGVAVPPVRLEPDATVHSDIRSDHGPAGDDRAWLVKPMASGGGHGVHVWHRDAPMADGCYLQEFVDGWPGSIVFVAAGGRVVPLGVSRQLIGDPAFGAAGYRYCGSILMSRGHDDAFIVAACAAARAVAEAFDLRGINGLDFIAHGGRPHVLEVNPRWTASVELMERACGMSAFSAHADAFITGSLPRVDWVRARGQAAVGKAVVFAREDVTMGATTAWLGDDTIRDVPHPGELIRAGRPVCTAFAGGSTAGDCYAALVRKAERVYSELAAWATQAREE